MVEVSPEKLFVDAAEIEDNYEELEYKNRSNTPLMWQIKSTINAVLRFRPKNGVLRPRSTVIINVAYLHSEYEIKQMQNHNHITFEHTEAATIKNFNAQFFAESKDKQKTKTDLVFENLGKPRRNQSKSKKVKQMSVEPHEIVFTAPYKKIKTKQFNLTNITKENILWRLKMTDKNLIQVEPKHGVIVPDSPAVFVTVSLFPFDPNSVTFSKNARVTIEYTTISNDVTEFDHEKFTTTPKLWHENVQLKVCPTSTRGSTTALQPN